ncbi:abhydrolase domain-containing protein [Pyrus ussuriensis x Pyrus communis]|uniref:Abhydrolase domain-containing protein n=1 Tax=Pyrus ussuriensis x Pyrus communis TaxID=2448454 RepID=A0A5N5GDD2_9ROSA|nr:abhydrolase domain-containing protein [Pyrus ussuriensis x Pyrus communis]
MPSLAEIAAAQPAFQNHLGTLRAQTPVYGNVFSSPFAFGNDKKLPSAWKLSHISIKLNFNLGRINVPKGSLRIMAVATLESRSLVQNDNANVGYDGSELGRESSRCAGQLEPSSDDSEELDDREKLRRLRISNANKGSTPWNKGRKHSPETLQLIKERTRLAMQNPKVKMKLVNLGHAQSEETRVKIGLGVRIGWRKRREKLSLQEHCCYDWQNLIAEASRQGYDGEEELQWDIYKILDEKLTEEYIERVEQRKIMRRPKGSKRAPKSLEQRRKISQAISAKWNDPNYRSRVCSALAKYYDASYGPERKPTKKPSGSTESARRVPAKKKVSEKNSISSGEIKIQKQRLRLRSNAPMYKDPLASSKMEMIKNIRAQRAAAETEKTEAVERARLLIAEAEKAAMALEVAATKSAVARASLVETRQLIAEAIQFLESVETAKISSFENEDPSVASNEAITQDEKEAHTGVEELTEVDSGRANGIRALSPHENEDPIFASYEMITKGEEEPYTTVAGQIEAGNVKTNGTKTLSSTNEDSSFGNFTSEYMVDAEEDLSPLQDVLNVLEDPAPLEDMLNSEEDLSRPSTSGYGLPPFGFEELIKQSDLRNEPNQLEPNGDGERSKNLQLNGTKVQSREEETPCKPVTGATKRWIRGRLVEVGEAA